MASSPAGASSSPATARSICSSPASCGAPVPRWWPWPKPPAARALWAWRPIATMAASGPIPAAPGPRLPARARAPSGGRPLGHGAGRGGAVAIGAGRDPRRRQPPRRRRRDHGLRLSAVQRAAAAPGLSPPLRCRSRPARDRARRRLPDQRAGCPGGGRLLRDRRCPGGRGRRDHRRGRRIRSASGAEVARARSALARQRRFQAGLWRLFAAPRVGLAYARADTIVCRCEEVTLASDRRRHHGRSRTRSARSSVRRAAAWGAARAAIAGRCWPNTCMSASAGRWTSWPSSRRAPRSSPCRSAPSPPEAA